MIRRLLRERTLEQTVALTTALIALLLISAMLLVVHARVAAALRESLVTRGIAVARFIGTDGTGSASSAADTGEANSARSAEATGGKGGTAPTFRPGVTLMQRAAEAASADSAITYVVIHDEEGAVIASAGPLASVLDFGGELGSALPRYGDPVATNVRIQVAAGEATDVLEVAVPVRRRGANPSRRTVRIGLSSEPMRSQLQFLEIQLVAIMAALAAGAVAFALWIARRITAPLRRMIVGTQALSVGESALLIPESGPKEIADLASSFNALLGRLEEKAGESEEFQKALESLNATLEHQVQERTLALQESEEQYKTLIENSPDAILIVRDGRLRFVSPAFEETFGIPAATAMGQDFRLESLFDSSSSDSAIGRIAAWQRGDVSSPVVVTGRDANGHALNLEIRGNRIEFHGSPAVECLLVDMTDTIRLRERMSETEKLRALGELAGGVAHDFNNLLGAILGRVQLLRRKSFEDPIDRELSVIEKAALDGRETVLRIQEFSRTRRDRRFRAINLAEILRDAAEITRSCWQTESQKKNISVDLRLDTPEVRPVEGNASELREVFTNLILNSVDAMPQGGTLKVSCRDEGASVTVVIEDDGVGMTEEIRRHLFEPFFTTKGTRGMGLGTSVAYGIVTRHGGRIDVTTSLGKGSTFRLEFPAADATVQPSIGGEAPAPAAERTGRILVIDDEPEIAAILSDVLTGEGHFVETAHNGHEGLRVASLSPFDLVFTDLGMPDMSGWDVAEKILSNEPDLPIVLVTGWGASLDEADVRARGIRAVVHKPFEIAEVVRITGEVLSSDD